MSHRARPRRHAATRRTPDASPPPGPERKPEHQPIPSGESKPARSPAEAEQVRSMLDELFAKQGWSRGAKETPREPTPAELAAHDERVQRTRAELERIHSEVSKTCEAGEHEKCRWCGCACHRKTR